MAPAALVAPAAGAAFQDWAAATETSDWAAQSAPEVAAPAPVATTWGAFSQW